jgi:hypothetical protein
MLLGEGGQVTSQEPLFFVFIVADVALLQFSFSAMVFPMCIRYSRGTRN